MNCFSLLKSQDAKLEQLLKGKDLNSSLKIIDSLAKIGTENDPSKIGFYQNKRIEICKKFNNDTALGQALWKKARFLRKQGDLERAESLYVESEKMFRISNYSEWIISSLTGLGNVYTTKGVHDAAINTYHKALKLCEKIKRKDLAAPIYANMGNIFLNRNDLENAEQYYNKGLHAFEQLKDTLNAALLLDNIGNVYQKKKDYDLSLKYHLDALKLIEKIHDKNYLAESCINIGAVYIECENYKEAKKYLRRADSLYMILNSKVGLSILNINLGEIELKQNNPKDALSYFEKSLSFAKETGSFELQEAASINLYECYEKLNDPASALKWFKEYSKYKDTIITLESTKQINDLTEKYESKQKQAEIELLTKDKEINETKLAQNKILNIGLGIVIILTFILLSAFYFRYRDKKKANSLLEEKNKVIEEKQKEIFDSLQYAKQIQKLLLANHKLVNETLPDSFIMFKPKDIVSGDFYWAAKKEDRFYLAVCDSTGHGVPGAFMSLLNINFLNEAVIEKNIAEPNEVFNYVRKRLIDNISREGRQDGMDGILICVNERSKKVTYAAANNSPVIIKNGELLVADSDKMPIGKGEKNDSFKSYSVDISKGDMMILYTDGYADQFGGPKGKKFKYKPLNEILLKNHQLPVLEQEEYLYSEFDKWKGTLEQVDDVCILGIRF